MINVNLNKPEFEYDIHSLIKAFFPKDDVEIYYTGDDSGGFTTFIRIISDTFRLPVC